MIDRVLDQAAAKGETTRALVLDASAINRLDSSADVALHELDDSLRKRGVALHFAGVKGPVRDMMQRSGLKERLGDGRLWVSVHDAVFCLTHDVSES